MTAIREGFLRCGEIERALQRLRAPCPVAYGQPFFFAEALHVHHLRSATRHHVDFRSGIRRRLRDGLCVG